MFNFRSIGNQIDTSLFDPDEDMDLVTMIDNARSEREIQSIARMSRARMRARRRQLDAAGHPRRHSAKRSRGAAAPSSLPPRLF